MNAVERYPAVPLMTNDPYFSVWSCSDLPTSSSTRHWTGERKRLEISVMTADGSFRLLGTGEAPGAEVTGCTVEPLLTRYTYQMGDETAELAFCTPLLPDDLDLLSTPVTLLRLRMHAPDARVRILWHDDICYNGLTPPPMNGVGEKRGDLYAAMMGKQKQNVLGHSGDGICIDWGYAWMLSDSPVRFERQAGHTALKLEAGMKDGELWVLLAYDDVVAIDYFGYPAKAWYARKGKTLPQALSEVWEERQEIVERCERFGNSLMEQAQRLGGEDYRALICASYRQTIAAHKLIADEAGDPVFLSKENNSNGCIGTVDVSYPSVPLFLLYNPELVRAMCRPILRFARYPVWKYDYAPHDVGRYPYATGQVYSLKYLDSCNPLCDPVGLDGVHAPYYLLSENADVYEEKYQMPVEECGNMLLMMAAAVKADGNDRLARQADDLLCKWASYLAQYGEDPGEQLCTDDFAGHLARNVNLAIKATCALAAYGYLCEKTGRAEEAKEWREKAKHMADSIQRNADCGDHTSLTLDGDASSWSLKYNAVWDLLFDFGLFGLQWYQREIQWYLMQERKYGIPLDSRKTYTKSDWILWSAAMSSGRELQRFCAPVARYLRETPSRVPFSDWYETEDGRSVSFIARSVQGGIFMPLLRERWKMQG